MKLTPIALLLVVTHVQASDDGFYKSHEEGWFWYQDPPVPVQIEEPKVPATAPHAGEPERLSPKWLRENFPKLMDQALEHPSKENIEQVAYANKVMLDMSSTFANRWADLVRQDKTLDESRRMPFGAGAKAAWFREIDSAKVEGVRQVAAKAGLLIFWHDKCGMCAETVPTLAELKKAAGFRIEAMSNGGRKAMAQSVFDRVRTKGAIELFNKLNLTRYPATVLVSGDGFSVLSDGVSTYSELVERVLVAGKELKLIDAETLKAINIVNDGEFTPEQIAGTPTGENMVDALKKFGVPEGEK